jgi:hypothetical protein
MTDTLDSETNGDGGEVLDPRIREELKRSREHQTRAAEAEARAEAAERRSVFAEVGIPTTGIGSLFREAYKGDLTPEAVKSAAEGYGVLGAPSEPEDSGLTEAERATQQRIAGAGTGVPPAGSDPRVEAANKIMAIPYVPGEDPAIRQGQIMEIVRSLEDSNPELGRYTNPNN